jgi:uncharacterized protein (DUF3820 family)
MADRTWMNYKMPFGKYKGDTLAIIRMNDIGYLVWAAENIKQAEVKEQLNKAIAYINEVDPWSLSGVSARQQE